ncbi:oxidoreductase [Tamlana nanhaiensis]|uniref:Oxidoreductase n=1 Tax=Neotamlana nanhaiensis TaxID=1382798 RepID=A0A0D7W2X5_9FLAO|nr:SDR family oxidoreductase [Tamlana nanhaiensis]KJD33379.1 oxidoreductase [Tamlana nanhaiensis]
MNNILITGATGALGSLVVKHLSNKIDVKNIAVLVRDKTSDKAQAYKQQGITVKVGDYNNLESLSTAFKNVDVLYFVSGNDVENRLKQHQNVVEAAKNSDIKQVFYTSSVRKTESESAPLFPVIETHKQTEDLLINSGKAYTILRHSLYAEVIPLFIGSKEQLLATKTVFLPTENGKTAFVAREDFAEAEANLLLKPEAYTNQILEFNGSETVAFKDIANSLSNTLNENIQHVSPSITEFKNTLSNAGVPDAAIGLTTLFSEGIAQGEFDRNKTDIENILGRKTTPIATFIESVYS